jgi:short-subunit dehydrogenase
VESLSDALRVELSAFGIKVVLIEPGVIHTEFAEVAMATRGEETGGPYAVVLANANKLQRRFEATGVGPEHVARAIERAITARRPSARYVVPLRTYLVIAMFRLLPTSWMDAAFRALTGLSSRAFRQAPPG